MEVSFISEENRCIKLIKTEWFLQITNSEPVWIFNVDRKLCREICRLPLLWMHPRERQVEKIHKILIQTIGLFNISDTDYRFA